MPHHSIPSSRLPKPSGQAVVTIRTPEGGRRDVYLGAFNSPDSRREYARVVAEPAAVPAPIAAAAKPALGLTVDEVTLALWHHAERYEVLCRPLGVPARPSGSSINTCWPL